jgi:hypothetical protein
MWINGEARTGLVCNQTMGPDFLLRRAKGRTTYQTTRLSWSMARSRRVGERISLAQWATNCMQATNAPNCGPPQNQSTHCSIYCRPLCRVRVGFIDAKHLNCIHVLCVHPLLTTTLVLLLLLECVHGSSSRSHPPHKYLLLPLGT